MAVFHANFGFDYTNPNFGEDFRNATDRHLVRDVTLQGVTYPDGFVLEFNDPVTKIIQMLGHGIQTDVGDIVGGHLNAMCVCIYDPDSDTRTEELWLRGIDISAAAFYQCQLSPDQSDDRALVKEMFSGGDRIWLSAFDDHVNAGAGADKIFGGLGQDRIKAGVGADTVHGGAGDDLLTGGLGEDIFVFKAAGGHDAITDFKPGADQIRILTGAASFEDLTLTQKEKGVLVDFGDGSVVVWNQTVESLSAGDFLFA